MTEYHHHHDVTDVAHRADCAECASVWADLERISAEAAALPVLTPSRDLWSGIEARLDGVSPAAPVSPMPSPAATGRATARAAARWFSPATLRLAIAASALVAVTAGVTWRLAKAPQTTTTLLVQGGEPVVGGSVAVVSDVPLDSVGSALDRAVRIRAAGYEEEFQTMDAEIRTMQTLLEQRRGQLDSATVAVLERNLAVIDQAIRESRDAFQKDPASRFLAAQLSRSYTTKLTLLRSTAMMPAGT